MGAPVLRVARACSDLGQARRFYCDGLGLALLAEFAGPDGCRAVIAHRAGSA